MGESSNTHSNANANHEYYHSICKREPPTLNSKPTKGGCEFCVEAVALHWVTNPVQTERKQKNIITHKTKQYGNPRQLKRGTTCIISLDEIAKNENYTLCNTCKQIFSWGHITLWLQNHDTCTHCRTNLGIGNLKKYVNSAESKK